MGLLGKQGHDIMGYAGIMEKKVETIFSLGVLALAFHDRKETEGPLPTTVLRNMPHVVDDLLYLVLYNLCKILISL